MKLRALLRLWMHVLLTPVPKSGEETLIGGQAVMEGVMMRTPHSYAVAVRKPDGSVATEESPLRRLSEHYRLFRWPVLRGLATLGQAMWLGVRALRFSAAASLADGREKAAPGADRFAMGLNLAGSLLFFVIFYKVVPLYLATWFGRLVPFLGGRFAINMMDGVLRIALFLTFLWLVSRAKEIRRVFEYHGAEHKVVFNYESGLPVTVQNAQRFGTLHPRCGTSFLLAIMVLSMMVYALLPTDSFLLKLIARIALLPFVVGLSYELIRYSARRPGALLALLTRPGLWLQRITTRPPSNDQVMVAIEALQRAMALEKAQNGQLVIA